MSDEIVKLLKNELEFTDEYGDKQWVMGVSIREVAKGAYLARTVVQTNQSPYVDGTDIIINIRKGQAEIDLAFIEEAPMFHGGEIEDSISWLKENGEIVYSQIENPWDKEIY